jgi:hypothetical protein
VSIEVPTEKKIKAKKSAFEFSKNTAQHFQSVKANFKMVGIIEEDNKIVIYWQNL